MFQFIRHFLSILIPVLFLVFVTLDADASPYGGISSIIDSQSQIGGVRLQKGKLKKFYGDRGYSTVWSGSNQSEMIRFIENSYDHGLRPEYYGLAEIKKLQSSGETAVLDVLLTQAFFTYARDIHDGRVDPGKLGIKWYIQQNKIDVVAALNRALSSGFSNYVEKLSPQTYQYKTLRGLMKKYSRQAMNEANRPKIPSGSAIKPGRHDSRVPILKRRFKMDDIGIHVSDDPKSTFYSNELRAAVELYQSNHGLKIDGIVGAQTIARLNRSMKDKVDQIALTMERMRWLPSDLGERYVFVTTGTFHLDVYENDRQVIDMKTVIGRRSRQTPSFNSEISNIVFNPPWNVPANIARKDLLPKFRRDPGYAARNGYSIHSESGRVSAYDAVDGSNYFPYRIRQRPGDGNALGRIKFNMPNRHIIYLHDTPMKKLFERNSRSYSSGCVRLEDPKDLAEYILSREQNWTIDDVEERIDRGSTNRVDLADPVPVYIFYATVRVDRYGQAHFFKDIYRHDRKLKRAMKL